ncbi:hypothetical protein AB0O76_40635 [Streptomyces sp. NPDC086554]|uniref:phage tail tube protein n=1 Tax=Streptomyces sp. NPDC086554 TaxID=3154864 RepID=UPI003438C28B
MKSASFQLKATLMETNQLTTELFFGAKWVQAREADGSVIEGVWRLDLKSTPDLSELAIVVDWSQTVDGQPVRYRCVIGRAMISDRGAIQLQRAESGRFELTIDALDHSGSLGYVLTDDKVMDDPITVPAEVTLAPNTVAQDGHFDVVGKGFPKGETATVTVSPSGEKFTSTTKPVGEDGTFTIPVTVATDAPVSSEYAVSVKAGAAEKVVAVDKLTVEAKQGSF